MHKGCDFKCLTSYITQKDNYKHESTTKVKNHVIISCIYSKSHKNTIS
jgi:hypothetical protein